MGTPWLTAHNEFCCYLSSSSLSKLCRNRIRGASTHHRDHTFFVVRLTIALHILITTLFRDSAVNHFGICAHLSARITVVVVLALQIAFASIVACITALALARARPATAAGAGRAAAARARLARDGPNAAAV